MPAGHAVAGRAGSRARARWVAAGLAGAVALTYAGLALLAVPAVAGVLPRPLLAAWPRLLAGPGPGGAAVAWLAAALLAVSAGVVTARAGGRRGSAACCGSSPASGDTSTGTGSIW